MECKVVQRHLTEYLEQALTDDLNCAVEAHLEHCEACRYELTLMCDLEQALSDPELERMVLSDPSPLPSDFTDKVMQRVETEKRSGISLIWPWLRHHWSRDQYVSAAYAMGATAVVVSAGNLLFLWNQTTSQLAIWGVQAQAYWEAAQAHVGGSAFYLVGLWHNLLALL